MRSHRILSLTFVSTLCMILALSSTIIADDQDLVDINIPAWESVMSESKYTNPSKNFANQMTQWSNTVTDHAKFKGLEGDNLVMKREAAQTAAYGGDNEWKGNVIDWLKNTVTKDVATPVADFAKWLLGLSNKIDREQAFAEAAQAVNEHIPVVHDSKCSPVQLGNILKNSPQSHVSPT